MDDDVDFGDYTIFNDKKYEKKKIFITGVAGFLGSHLAEALVNKGHDVSGCDTLMGGYLDNVPEDVNFHYRDCCFLNTMNKLLKDIDIVYHTACTAYEGLSVFAPHLVCQNTFQITATVASAAANQKVKRFVNCSSMARYGEQEIVPFTEDMIPNPRDPYGISKLAGEKVLDIMSEVHGMEVVHAIPHNIIGPRQKYDDPYRNVASIMINRMLQGRQPIIYGDGSQKRCFSFIQDAIGCLEKLGFQDNVVGYVNKNGQKENLRINIGPDEEFITILELAETIADIIDFELDPIFVPGRPQEVKFAACSANRAREMLGYKTQYTLRQGLKEMIKYIRNRGTKKFRYDLDIEIFNDRTPETWTKKML